MRHGTSGKRPGRRRWRSFKSVSRNGSGISGKASGTALKGSTIALETIYLKEKSSLRRLIAADPVEFVHRFPGSADKEIAGFLASQFAYGRIEVMKRFLGELFERLGTSPRQFVECGDFRELEGLYYRLHKDREIIGLFEVLRRITGEFGGIGAMLDRFYDGDVRAMLWAVRAHLFQGRDDLSFFFPSPSRTNPAKRWSLYLRWMVRHDEVDQGIWGFIEPADLTVPLDTHIAKIGGCLRWTKRKNPSWMMAREITEALRRFSPDDPLKYDFFLCHAVGIAAGCTGERSAGCAGRCLVYEMADGKT